jgi:hypothetical protein
MDNRDLIYPKLKNAGLEPIFNYAYDPHHNVGSIVWVDRAKGHGSVLVGAWRIANPTFTVSLGYGFYAVADSSRRLKGGGHGTFLVIKPPEGLERCYDWGCGNVQVDQIQMPKQALIDFGFIQIENKAQYFRYPDLKWFERGFDFRKTEVMERETLLAEIQRRILEGSNNN